MHDVGLIAFPWYPSLETGRGHDTYAYHLLKNLASFEKIDIKMYPVISIRHLQQGVNKLDYLSKELLFFTKMFDAKSRIYHGISPLGAKTAILAGKRPLVSTIHDAIPFIHRRDIKQTYERLCTKLCCEKSDKLIFSSEFTKNYLKKELSLDSSKLAVVRYGVDRLFYYKWLKRPGNGKIIFSIVRWGNVEEFLACFKEVTKQVDDVKLFLGVKNSFDKAYKINLPKMFEQMDLKDSVKLIYDIPLRDLPSYYNAADIYVSPSMGGFSLTLLEAMACGTPVIAFDLMDAPEYVGNAGILVKPNDFQDLANEIVKLLHNKELINNLSKRSIEKTLGFSWQKMASETLEVYREVMSAQ